MNEIKTMREIIFIFLFISIVIPGKLISQITDSNVSIIGIKSGFADTYSDPKIGNHLSYGTFYEFPVYSELTMNIIFEYFLTNKNIDGIWKSFEYRGTIYNALTPYVWQNSSLGINFLYPVIHKMRLGLGLSLDLITVKSIRYTKENPFTIDDNENVILTYKHESDLTIVRNGINFLSDYSYSIYNQLDLFAEFQYKLTFVGKKYSDNYYHTLNMYTIFCGLKYKF